MFDVVGRQHVPGDTPRTPTTVPDRGFVAILARVAALWLRHRAPPWCADKLPHANTECAGCMPATHGGGVTCLMVWRREPEVCEQVACSLNCDGDVWVGTGQNMSTPKVVLDGALQQERYEFAEGILGGFHFRVCVCRQRVSVRGMDIGFTSCGKHEH